MVMTILEGNVAEENTSILINNYQEAVKELEPGMVTTYLVQDIKNPAMWRIITIWESKEVLEKMRGKGTPKGVLLFRSVGTEPALFLYDIAVNAGE